MFDPAQNIVALHSPEGERRTRCPMCGVLPGGSRVAELNIDHSERVIDGLFGQLHEPKEARALPALAFSSSLPFSKSRADRSKNFDRSRSRAAEVLEPGSLAPAQLPVRSEEQTYRRIETTSTWCEPFSTSREKRALTRANAPKKSEVSGRRPPRGAAASCPSGRGGTDPRPASRPGCVRR